MFIEKCFFMRTNRHGNDVNCVSKQVVRYVIMYMSMLFSSINIARGVNYRDKYGLIRPSLFWSIILVTLRNIKWTIWRMKLIYFDCCFTYGMSSCVQTPSSKILERGGTNFFFAKLRENFLWKFFSHSLYSTWFSIWHAWVMVFF